MVLAAIASRSSGRPAGRAVAVVAGDHGTLRRPPRRCGRGSGKSGSPAPNPMTARPAAFSALALASTASVADSAMAPTRAGTCALVRWHGLGRRTGVDGFASGEVRCDASVARHERSDPPDITIPPTCCRATDGSAPARPRCAPRRSRRWPRRSDDYLGTSHRQAPVRFMVSRLRNGLAELFSLPDGYEVILGNGGTTIVLGRGHLRPDRAAQPAPRLRRVLVEVRRGAPRPRPSRRTRGDRVGARHASGARSPSAGVDVYALTHNETSTGVVMPLRRPDGVERRRRRSSLVDATSAAGGLRFDPTRGRRLLLRAAEVPRLRRRAVARRLLARRDRAHRADRGVRPLDPGLARPRHRPRELPQGPDLQHARRWPRSSSPRSRSSGSTTTAGSSGRPARCDRSAETLYSWAEASDVATPFVERPEDRSHVVAHHRLRRTHRRDRSCRACCAATASSTPSPTASSAATSCASRCSRRSTPTTSPRSPAASTTSSPRSA